jgi:hypothetical protein
VFSSLSSVLQYLEFRTMDEVQKPSNSKDKLHALCVPGVFDENELHSEYGTIASGMFKQFTA